MTRRTIDGKTYVTAYGFALSKKAAQQIAKKRRKDGYPSRVVKVKGGYKVFSRG